MQEAKGRVYFLKWMDDFADCYLRWIVEAGIFEIDLPILARRSKWNWIGSDWTAYIKRQLILHFGWSNRNTNYSNWFLLIYDTLSASRSTSAFLTLVETTIKLVLINVAPARFIIYLFIWIFMHVATYIACWSFVIDMKMRIRYFYKAGIYLFQIEKKTVLAANCGWGEHNSIYRL